MSDVDASQDWVAAGLAELARGGIDGVRVEVLAARLGVTKGGFYRRYKDRRALLEAILTTWRDGRLESLARHVELGDTPAERLHGLVERYSERANAEGMAIELAIRQWARADAMAATAVREVDTERLKTVEQLYRGLGLSASEAEARAVLFYTFLFGQGLLGIGSSPRKRAQLIDACAAALIAPYASRMGAKPP